MFVTGRKIWNAAAFQFFVCMSLPSKSMREAINFGGNGILLCNVGFLWFLECLEM